MGTRTRTAVLFAVIIAIFIVVGGLVGEFIFGSWLAGLVVALTLAMVLNLVSYFLCDRLVLWSTRAKIVTPTEAPRLAAIVDELAPSFGLIAPRLAIVPSPTPNAFATGRDERHAVVAVTQGILPILNDRELRGVLAHELAHVRDRDVLVMTFAATVAGAISYAAQIAFFSMLFGGSSNRSGTNPILLLLALVTAPIAAMLIQLAISRSREFRADEVGALTIGDPEALASALQKLDSANARHPMRVGSPAQSSLFIVNPFRGASFAAIFSTHPPTAERVRRLRSLRPDRSYRPRVGGPSFATTSSSRPLGS
ncbi:MAG TPA: zinc metalloprotease HtpX [Thermoplasmata archaeon]|jgi:heat shock protein HtpX|nr:zinc metalloprotease HtpX [Thermoplasmata archaeon]